MEPTFQHIREAVEGCDVVLAMIGHVAKLLLSDV